MKPNLTPAERATEARLPPASAARRERQLAAEKAVKAERALRRAAFDALDEHRPFSSLDTYQIRYLGGDPVIMNAMIDQALRTTKGKS